MNTFKKVTCGTVLFCAVVLSGCSVVSELRTMRTDGEIAMPEFAPYEGLKRTIAVLDFRNATRVGDEKMGSAISDMIIAVLVRSGRFTVVERYALEELLEEQALGQAGVLNEASAPRVADIIGAHALVFGSITDIRLDRSERKIDPDKKDWSLALQASVANIVIDFRVVDPSTGELLLADNSRARKIRPGLGVSTEEWEFSDLHDFDETLLGKASREAAHQAASKIVGLVSEIEWQGKILRVSATRDSVFFTPGLASGIRIGDQFEVFAQNSGDEENIPGPVGTIEVFDFIGDRVSRAVVLEGDRIRAGDLVREKLRIAMERNVL